MSRLDPDELRAYARRDWGAPERMSRARRAAMPVAQKVALAVALYEAARRSLAPADHEAARRADLEHHLRLRALLDRAARVGAE